MPRTPGASGAQAGPALGVLACSFSFWLCLCYDWKTVFPLTISRYHSSKTWKRPLWGESQRNKSLAPAQRERLGLKVYRGHMLLSDLVSKPWTGIWTSNTTQPNEFSVAFIFVSVRFPEWQPCYCTSPSHVRPTEAVLIGRNRDESQILGTQDCQIHWAINQCFCKTYSAELA